jgi:hypothetical protein
VSTMRRRSSGHGLPRSAGSNFQGTFFTISRLLGMCEFRTVIVEKQKVFLGGIVVVVSKSTVCRSKSLSSAGSGFSAFSNIFADCTRIDQIDKIQEQDVRIDQSIILKQNMLNRGSEISSKCPKRICPT